MLGWSAMVLLFCTDGLIGYCAFCVLYSPSLDFVLSSFLIPLYPTFVQELDRECPQEAGARGYGYREELVLRDENGYQVCEKAICSSTLLVFAAN